MNNTIHLIWFGKDPNGYARAAQEHWALQAPERECLVHCDNSLLLPEWRNVWDKANTPILQSDLLRWSILLTQGGWYFDVDVRLQISLSDFELLTRPAEDVCVAMMMGNNRNALWTNVLNFNPEWPGGPLVREYIAGLKEVNASTVWLQLVHLINCTNREWLRPFSPNSHIIGGLPILYYDPGLLGPEAVAKVYDTKKPNNWSVSKCGDQLHAILSKLRLYPKEGCDCEAWRQRMNLWGPTECKRRLGEIVDHMLQVGRNRLPGLRWPVVGRLAEELVVRHVAERMVLHAIRLAERELASRPTQILVTVTSEKPTAVEQPESSVTDEQTPRIDVVYALGRGTAWCNNELRYSLRSLERYAQDLGRVFIVGERPPWLQNVIHIPMGDTCHCNKDANIINKVRAAIAAGCSKQFVFASDDQLLLTSVWLGQLANYASHDLSRSRDIGRNKWRRRLRATAEYLMVKGFPAHNYDTHVFQLHTVENFEHAVSQAPYDRRNGFCINTLVLNQDPTVQPKHDRACKARFYSRCSQEQVVRSCAASGRIHLSYTDAGLLTGIAPALQQLFPEVSRFETEDIPMSQQYQGRRQLDNGTYSLLLDEELTTIIELLPPASRLLEIGTYEGASARLIAERRSDVAITCLDPRPRTEQWQSNQRPNMILVVGTVDTLLARSNCQYDVILVDGSHKYGPCYRDLWAASRMLAFNGTILAHDYRAVRNTHVYGQRGVTKAVTLFCRRYPYQITAISGSLALLKRHD